MGSNQLYLFIGQPSERSPGDTALCEKYDYDFFQNELSDVTGLREDLIRSLRQEDDAETGPATRLVFQEYTDLMPKIYEVNAMSEDMKKVRVIAEIPPVVFQPKFPSLDITLIRSTYREWHSRLRSRTWHPMIPWADHETKRSLWRLPTWRVRKFGSGPRRSSLTDDSWSRRCIRGGRTETVPSWIAREIHFGILLSPSSWGGT